MKFFRLGYFEWGKVKPEVWIEKWAELFLMDKERQEDDQVYESLIQKKGQLSAEGFEQIGRWKEGCLVKEPGKEHGRWNPKNSSSLRCMDGGETHAAAVPCARKF